MNLLKIAQHCAVTTPASCSRLSGHGTTHWFQIGKGVHQSCILLPCLFSLYAGYIIQNATSPLLPSCWGFSFALGYGVSFGGGVQHSLVDGCWKASCKFGVLAGEDEYTSFYSTILTFWLSAFRMWGSKGHQDPNCETQAQHPCMWVFRRSFTSLFTQLWSVNLHLAWQQGLLPTEVNSTVIQAYALTWRVMLKKLWLNGSMKTCKNF